MNVDMIKDIPRYGEWIDISVPPWGWSANKKFRILDKNGLEFILRVSDIAYYEEKKNEYENIVRLSSQTNITMSNPIEFGICNGGKSVYLLLTWIKGVAVEDVIRSLDESALYDLGILSGQLLREVHINSSVTTKHNWGDVYSQKIDEMIASYKRTNIVIPQDKSILDYINANRKLLYDRPQVIRHGDFHVGNLIITPDSHIGVIDFDKCDIGDGWEEFGGIVWAARFSSSYAKGQVEGYFQNHIPDNFFRLLALYIGFYALDHVVRSARTCVDIQVAKQIVRNTNFMSAMFDDFTTHIPSWYRR